MGKILVITNHSYMLYRFRLDFLKALLRQHEVVLSMPFVGHEADFQAAGFQCVPTPVDRRGCHIPTDWKLLHGYRKLIRQEKPDLVISYSVKPNIYGGIACRMAKVPYCANVQGLGSAIQRPWLRHLVMALYRFSLKKASIVFFENAQSAQFFQRKHLLPSGRIRVLNGAGVDLTHYSYQPYPQNPVFRFLFVGRIMREKGIEELLYAAKQLHRDGYSFILDIVGFFEDSIKDQIQQTQLQGIVYFHGFQENPIPFYSQADCIVLPSYHEGMSNVLLEAAAIGRPVIASDIPGCREAIDCNISGFLCPPKNASALYEAMKKMLLLPAAQRSKMGKAARRKMQQSFDKKQVVQETLDALSILSPLHSACD